MTAVHYVFLCFYNLNYIPDPAKNGRDIFGCATFSLVHLSKRVLAGVKFFWLSDSVVVAAQENI